MVFSLPSSHCIAASPVIASSRQKELERIQAKLASSAGGELASQAIEIDGIKVLAVKLDGVEPKAMVELLDQLKNKLGTLAISAMVFSLPSSHCIAASPVIASSRRTPDATPVSLVILNRPISYYMPHCARY
jgi:alanyl-tRNA synthetase